MDDLIQRARKGDDEAFATLFEHSKQPLWRAAMAVLGNVDDASDALQETAIKAWRAMPRFGGRSAVGTWFMRILLRTCYDFRRTRKRETPCAMGVFDIDVEGSDVSWEPSAGQMLAGGVAARDLDREEALDVRDALGRLTADDRLVLVLFYVNDFPVRQISQIMNVSEGAVRTRLSRARDRFKVAYTDGSSEEAEVAR
ncbi:RNA polymerase sigma factor [Eggerthella guodeyinii]|uniref:Sigma-70 family RNA polymerase sigma factor n=1 Tax=Eggerthella guodeyinii TaxID=2690837 RepID=A0A6N7RQK0_9ACTN|nr:sigma-70 family RNA polymerase sigma factor [Eggerthella guodeyinii]